MNNKQILASLPANQVIDLTKKKRTLQDIVDAHTPAPKAKGFPRLKSNKEILGPVLEAFGWIGDK